MNSDSVAKKKARRAKNQSQHYGHDLLLTSPRPSTASQPIDISGEDDEDIKDLEQNLTLPKLPYQGTARLHPSKREIANSSRSIKSSEGRKKSPFFADNAAVVSTSNGARNRDNFRRKLSEQIEDQSESLSSRFVTDTGKRRGSGFHLSSDRDELDQTGNTVRPPTDLRASSPTKQSRRNSPVKDLISRRGTASDTEEQDGMERSTVKHSTWLPKPKAASDARTLKGRSEKLEADAPVGFELAAISVDGVILQGNGLGFVSDATTKAYRVQKYGKYSRTKTSSLSIIPEKLQRIDWGTSGGKVRFTSSRSGTDDNVLDLHFRKEKDTNTLVVLLSPNCRTVSHDSDHMDKVFKTRRAEIQKQSPNDGSKVVLQEVQMSAIKQTIPEMENPKTQRKSGGLVDKLVARATQDNDTTTSARNEISSPTTDPETMKPRGLIKPPEHNNHLRRSSRTSSLVNKICADPFDDYPDVLGGYHDDLHDDVPLHERFSRVHGLGNTWSKPLTYPKQGKKKTTVEFSDLERLDEGEFLNDNLISFYLRYLEQTFEEQRPDLAKSVYFFNTYFYTTLTNAHKPRKSFNYEGVQKWTRAVDIFTYDYIIVPICENTHWYLAIICNLPHLDRIAMPEEGSSSQTETGSFKAIEDQNEFDAPLSSPVDEHVQRDTTPTRRYEKEPDEREARDSFAEMSLNHEIIKPAKKSANVGPSMAAETTYAHVDDKEMLDAQLEATMPEFTVEMAFDGPAAESAKQQVANMEDPIEDPDQIAKTNAKTKKQKRKSMPPPVTKLDPSKPAIITFDSLGQTRSTTLRTLKQYLVEEARTKRGGMEIDTTQIKGVNAKVPQQENFSDCGLFLLGYVSQFLEEDPKDFITKIIGREYTARKDWSKLDPSTMRAAIRDQVQELYKAQKDEERQSAIKSGKYKGNQKVQSSPTPVDRVKAVIQDDQHREETTERTEKGEHKWTDKTTSQLAPDLSSPREDIMESLMSQLTRAATDFGEGAKEVSLANTTDDKQAEDLHPDTARKLQEAGSASAVDRQRGASTATQRQSLAELPWTKSDEPSVIEIESQSQSQSQNQQDISAPRSNNPTQLSPRKREASELPSEVPDSQPSEPAKSFPQVLVPAPSPKRKTPDARSDRATRRKTFLTGLKSAGAEVIDIDD
ncbi:hypothetical protein P7C71_g2551, partial [Lecanoromycetidae sp. Uapishka_2]